MKILRSHRVAPDRITPIWRTLFQPDCGVGAATAVTDGNKIVGIDPAKQGNGVTDVGASVATDLD